MMFSNNIFQPFVLKIQWGKITILITILIPIYALTGLPYNVDMILECDLNFLPFNRESGQDNGILPGLAVAFPPRRVARGREWDHLFIYLSLNGNNPIQLDEYTKITQKMTDSFYSTQGSLTSALRNTADLFNQVLMTRNLGTTGQGQYIVGRLIMGVLRGSRLVVVQSGPTHIFHLTGTEVEHLHDPSLSGRGLGFTQTTNLFYSQIDLKPGEHLVFCSHLPENWMSALANERGATSLEALYRKLQSTAVEDVGAAIVQVVEGNGNLNLLVNEHPTKPIPISDPQMAIPDYPQYHQTVEIPNQQDEQVDDFDPLQVQDRSAYTESQMEYKDESFIGEPGYQDDLNDSMDQPSPEMTSQQNKASSRFMNLLGGSKSQENNGIQDSAQDISYGVLPRVRKNERKTERKQRYNSNLQTRLGGIKRLGSKIQKPVFSGLLSIIQWIRNFGKSIADGSRALFQRMLPTSADDKRQVMSGSTMAFIAMFIPIIVVIIASLIYVRFGRSAQYEENYQLAVSEAVGAIGQSDPAMVRRAWESTLYYLDRADSYQTTQDSYTLRLQAQGSLDAMDQIIRLDFRPAIYGGLPRTITVGKMAASETDLYMLDEVSGSVIRAYLTSSGYILDDKFVCGPGAYPSMGASTDTSANDSIDVYSLIDLQVLPRVNPFGETTLMAMDNYGTLIYCRPDAPPSAWKLEAPDILWKEPVGFALSGQDDTLYVLDPTGNAVWYYDIDGSNLFSGKPGLYFSGNYVPKELNQAVDIAVTGSDLYFLFKDGHVSNCTPGQLGDVVPMRCNDPETMTDMRVGYQSGIVLSDATFTEMTFTTPPDPSIYMLDPITAAVYRFSPRQDSLYLQNQLRATVDQDKTLFTSETTSMAISPNRSIFLSSGNQVYFAMDIP